jgi:hypothetical protein
MAKAWLATVAEAGVSEEIAGAGFVSLMSNVAGFETPPPGAGFWTTTLGLPVLEISPAGTEAVSDELVTNVVASGWPFQTTTEVGRKPLPPTLSVNCGPAAVAALGMSEETCGTGFAEASAAGDAVLPGSFEP